ncbi:MAG: bacterial Ig-like domain-containing protein [Paludibacteraceae bacterium]|nr:bacterial Ig-like domain-containing protein [Paludibacteraceae bacterium]
MTSDIAVSASGTSHSFTVSQSSGTKGKIFISSISVTYDDGEGGGDPTLSSIAVKTPPTKVSYTEGENFDPTGLVITRTYSDASTLDWSYAEHTSDFTFTPSLATALTTGNTSVTITYGGKSTTQAITVTSAGGGGGGSGSCDVFSETWDGCVGTGGNSGGWSGSVASGADITSDNAGWTYSSGYKGDKCIRTNKAGKVRTPSISVTSGSTYTLSYKAADWGTDGCSFTISATGATVTEGASSGVLSRGSWGDYTATLTATASTMQITFTASSGARGWLDEICIGSSGPIKVTSSFTEFTYVLGGGPSASQTFKVEGTDLAGNLTITAPINYQVSQNGSSWSNSVTLNKNVGDDVPETTLYIRLNSDLAKGDYDGNITFSDGTNNKTVAVEGSVTLSCTTPSISFTEATVNKYRGDADFKITPSVSGNALSAAISWSSDKESCATVGSDGTVHIIKATGAGAYVRITATLPYTETAVACQNEVSAYYDIYIKNKITWLVSGATYTAGGPDTEVTEGAKITTAPTDPDGSSMCGGKTFVGWTTSEVAVEQATAPSPLYSATTVKDVNITDNTTFYAVFAESGGGSDEIFKKGTSADLEDGQTVIIVNAANNKALASTATASELSLVATTVSISSDQITNPASSLKWTVVNNSSNYQFMNGGNYLRAGYYSGTYTLNCSADYDDTWSVATSGDHYIVNSDYYNGYKLEYYATNDEFTIYNGSGNQYLMDFYFPYTSYSAYSTTCGPNIKAGEVERLTSTLGQIVRSQAITIKGSSLTGGTLSVKSITGDDSQFTYTLASQTITAGAIETTYTISYIPTVYDATHTAEIIFWDGITESNPITLRGRSLPEHFAIVAYDGANYYALDGSMTGTAKQATPLPVEVSANTVVSCPTRAIYSLTQRETPDANVYLVGPAGRLWGSSSSSDLNTKSLTSTSQTGWLLSTSDFDTYHITNADVSTRGIMYNSTNDVFGHYSTSLYGSSHYYGDIQLLPITDVCTCLPKPFPTPIARAQSVTITWAEVPGAVSYVVTCSGGNAPVYDGCKATITGLSNSTNYTYTVKAVASGNDCSLIYSGNFTTTDCDDVPYAISVAPALTSATFRWSMEAASATIRIYSDEECTAQVGSDHTGLTSPATITGLAENTTYYAKIWAGGTCVSAVTSFTTNSPSVELAEWFTDSIRIVVDAGADASVIIEDKNDNGSSTASVAEDIFFSKYYEAAGFTKLVGLYNGTDHDIDLSDLKIIGGTTSWSTSKSDNNYVVLKDVSKLVSDYGDGAGHIYLPRGTEIIFYSLNDDNSSSGTKPMTGDGCLDEFYGWDELANNTVDNWYRIGNLSAGSDGDGHTTLNFSGPYSIGLKRGSKLIDIIGAGNVSAPTNSATVKVTDSKTLGNGRTVATPNDKEGFWYENGWSPRPMEGDVDYASYPDGYSTYLSTNRCLLIRANHVVSGDSAVQNNKSEFKTLGEYEDEEFKKHKGEWVGIPIGKISNSTEDYCFSGQQFGYVGSYDYNAYYATYDSIAELKNLTGKQNDDGTYTIPIPQLDTLSCTMLRVNVYEGSELKTSAEYKVPIMVEGNKTTQDTIFVSDYPTQTRTAETCKECDVVILKGATLTKAENGLPKDAATVGNLTIYPGGTMDIPNSRTFNVASVQFRVEGENVPFIKLSGMLHTSDQQVLVSRRINNSDAYFFSLPYDCNISDIRWSNGEPAVLDNGFRIKEYDSRARAEEGSTKGAPGHWKMVTGSTLEAGKGYQISVNSKYLKELIFPLDLGKTNVSDAENEKHYNSDNVVPIHQYENVATTINNHNWNFIAQPYLCAMTPMAGDAITYGYLDWKVENDEVVWERKEVGNQYLTIYDPSSKTYTQKSWTAVSQLDPFLAFFVQGKAEGTFTFVEGNRLNNAPARHLASQAEVDEDPSIFVGVTLSGNGLTDQANLRVRQDFTEEEYKLGYDLLKFTTYYKDRPQVYMKTPSYQLAFQAVNDSVAKNTFLPMGVYCYKPGTYTFGLSNDYPIDEVEAVYLYDKVSGVTTNLLYDTYTITTSSQLYTNTRFALNVIVNRRAPQVTTDIGIPEAPDNIVRKILINGHVYIQRGAAIYDITGKQMLNF